MDKKIEILKQQTKRFPFFHPHRKNIHTNFIFFPLHTKNRRSIPAYKKIQRWICISPISWKGSDKFEYKTGNRKHPNIYCPECNIIFKLVEDVENIYLHGKFSENIKIQTWEMTLFLGVFMIGPRPIQNYLL